VIDMAPLAFGMTGEIAARIGAEAFDHLDAPVRVGAPMTPVPFSPAPFTVHRAEDVVVRSARNGDRSSGTASIALLMPKPHAILDDDYASGYRPPGNSRPDA
jgi:hypothetical protein